MFLDNFFKKNFFTKLSRPLIFLIFFYFVKNKRLYNKNLRATVGDVQCVWFKKGIINIPRRLVVKYFQKKRFLRAWELGEWLLLTWGTRFAITTWLAQSGVAEYPDYIIGSQVLFKCPKTSSISMTFKSKVCCSRETAATAAS